MATRAELMGQIKGPQTPASLAEARRAQQRMAIRQQVASLPTGQGAAIAGPQAAAQVGQQAAQQVGQINTQQVQQQGQQAAQVGQQAVQTQANEAQNTEAQRALDLGRTQQQLESDFAVTSRGLKADLYDKAMQFQKDEQGRTFLNEKQLLDYKLSRGISEEEWADYQQEATQAAEREIQLMESAYRKLEQDLSQDALDKRTDISNETRRQIVEMKAALERQIAKKKAAAANRSAMMGALGTVAGVGAVTLATGGTAPAAAILAGGVAGGGLGQIAAGSQG